MGRQPGRFRGRRDRGVAERVHWLLGFAQAESGALSPLAARAFVTGAPAGVVVGRLPHQQQIKRAQQWLRAVLRKLGRGRAVDVRAAWRGWLEYSDWEGGLAQGRTLSFGLMAGKLPFLAAFRLRAVEALTGLAHDRHWLKFCRGCHQPFVAKRHDAGICSSACRSVVWRAGHRNAVNKARRVRYLQHQESQHGRPIKIQKRQG
jgi:hypothetical protein